MTRDGFKVQNIGKRIQHISKRIQQIDRCILLVLMVMAGFCCGRAEGLAVVDSDGSAVAETGRLAMVDNSRAERFLDVYVQTMAGGSYLTDNYRSCYPEITDLNSSMRPAFGAGVGVRFNIRKFLGLGTELNFTRNGFNMDIAVVGAGGRSVSNVFQRNVFYRVDIPVFMSFIFNLSQSVKWNVDGGMYYAYGLSGKQKNTIYNTQINELEQLMVSVTPYETDFYNDNDAFINSYHRGDIGLHLATGLTFAEHLRVGVRGQLGFSNLANSTGIVKPSSHNINFMVTVGWQF